MLIDQVLRLQVDREVETLLLVVPQLLQLQVERLQVALSEPEAVLQVDRLHVERE